MSVAAILIIFHYFINFPHFWLSRANRLSDWRGISRGPPLVRIPRRGHGTRVNVTHRGFKMAAV
jgi:hypothetical protein